MVRRFLASLPETYPVRLTNIPLPSAAELFRAEAVLKRLHAEIVKAVTSKDVVEKLTAQAAETSTRSPEELRAFIKTEHDKYERIVKTVGIKPE